MPVKDAFRFANKANDRVGSSDFVEAVCDFSPCVPDNADLLFGYSTGSLSYPFPFTGS